MSLLVLSLLGACTDKVVEEDLPDDSDYPASALVLVMDGVRVEEFTSSFASDLTGLSGQDYARKMWEDVIPQGALVRAAINPGITITAPGHLEMLTGRVDAFANYGVDEAGVGQYRPELPTLFEETRSQLGLDASQVVLLANTELLQPVTSSLYPGLGEAFGATYQEVFDPDKPDAPVNDDGPVVDALKALIRDDHPRLTMVNLHDVDRAGHYGGDDAYVGDVAKLDDRLSEFWRWLADHEPGYQRNLMIFLTADHGRHRHEDDQGWRNHGDDCSGCREVPLVMFGPGVHAGEELAGSYTLWDYGPTLAAHLGVTLPFASGLPLSPAYDTVDAPSRTGDTRLIATGDHTMVTRYLDSYEARSEVIVDGQVLSSEGAFAAESAALVDTPDGLVACFRELTLTPGELYWPWVPRCLVDVDGSWVDMSFPLTEVGTNWAPAFAVTPSGIFVAWNHNPDGIGELGANNDVGIHVQRYLRGKWAGTTIHNDYFPVEPSIVSVDGGIVIAYGTNDAGEVSRNTRHIRVLRYDSNALGELELLAENDLNLSGALGDDPRFERARLASLADASLAIAFTAVGPDGRDVFVSRSTDDGLTWSAPEAVGSANPVFAHLAPQWDGSAVVWAAQGADGLAEICRLALKGTTTCYPTESTRLDSYGVVDGGAWVSIDVGSGEWEADSVVFR